MSTTSSSSEKKNKLNVKKGKLEVTSPGTYFTGKKFFNLLKQGLGIVVVGGPAPGTNSVISSIVVEAFFHNYNTFGFIDGFTHLSKGLDCFKNDENVKKLERFGVHLIHTMSGSIIKSSRTNPTTSIQEMENVAQVLKKYNIQKLIVIGGVHGSLASFKLQKYFDETKKNITIVQIPKTINNDIDLPSDVKTFGYESARSVGCKTVKNLMRDAHTAQRFFICIVQGRYTGHLALGICKSVGAHLALIPEEFEKKGKVTVKTICDEIEGCIIKRKVLGIKENDVFDPRNHGVILIAEGLLNMIKEEDFDKYFKEKKTQKTEVANMYKTNQFGELRFREFDFGRILRDEMRKRSKEKGWFKMKFTEKHLGYEMRCAKPNAFDLAYTKDLGCIATRHIVNNGKPGIIFSRFVEIPSEENGKSIMKHKKVAQILDFKENFDEKKQKMKYRKIDIKSEGYQVAQKYMARLKKEDFKDPEKIKINCQVVNMNEKEFKDYYEYLVE